MTRPTRAAWIVLLVAAAFLSVGAAGRGLWEADEHRIAEIARVMTTPHGDLFLPHLDGAVYYDKPPLVAWIVALFHGPLGVDLATAAKVPSILGGALATMATFLIGRRLYGNAAGLAAAAVLATSVEFDWICRRSQYDPLLTGFTTLGLWFFVRSRFPVEGENPRPWTNAVVGSLCVGMGALVKGPVALAFTLPTVLAFAAAAGEFRTLATRRTWAALLVLAPVAAWLAPATVEGGWDYFDHIVFKEGVGHPAGDVDKVGRPLWYYVADFPKSFLPWTLLLPAAVVLATRRREPSERRADLFVLSWLVVPFVLMSVIPAKRGLYLLPLLPAAALCVAKLAAVDEERLRTIAFAVGRRVFEAVAVLVGAALALAAVLVLTRRDSDLVDRIAWWTAVRDGAGAVRVAVALGCGVAVLLLGLRSLKATPRTAFVRLTMVSVLGSLVFAGVALPAADPAVSPRRFYERATLLVGDAPLARWGVDDFAGHSALRRETIPFVKADDPATAAAFLAKGDAPRFVVVEGPTLAKQGLPAGARIVLEEKLPLDKDLLLLGRR